MTEKTSAFMKPLKPNAALAAIVGAEPLPRTEIVSKLWAHIRAHKLQDAGDRRMINTDAALAAVCGGEAKVSMFALQKHISGCIAA